MPDGQVIAATCAGEDEDSRAASVERAWQKDTQKHVRHVVAQD